MMRGCKTLGLKNGGWWGRLPPMRFLAAIFSVCVLSVLSSCLPAHSFHTAEMPYYKRTVTPGTLHRPTAIPRAARNTKRSGLNPARPLLIPMTPAPTPNCAAVCVIDPHNGKILFSHNAHERRQVASTQKIVTALCVCDEGDLDKTVTIKASDCKEPPIRLRMRPGQEYKKIELLKAMLISSYNDVAVALARDTAGSVEQFVERMNARARRMRMHDTHFANPNGLPAEQYSTAHDMALAACYAYNNRTIRSIINIAEYDLEMPDGRMRTIRNTNHLLRSYPWVQGMKTGYTNLAGKCLISCGSNNGRAVIVVVLGSTNSRIWGESLKYLKWALQMP